MPTCSLLSCCWKKVFAITSMFSWQNFVSLCPASFCSPRPNLCVLFQLFVDFLLLHSNPLWCKRPLFLVLVLEGLVGLHRITWCSFFSINGWGTDLDYCDVEWFALQMNQDHSVIHLNLTFLKPWANQWIFLMEMLVLSYVNVLCIYPRLYLQEGSA